MLWHVLGGGLNMGFSSCAIQSSELELLLSALVSVLDVSEDLLLKLWRVSQKHQVIFVLT